MNDQSISESGPLNTEGTGREVANVARTGQVTESGSGITPAGSGRSALDVRQVDWGVKGGQFSAGVL